MTRLGHKSLTETFRCVHVAQAHRREIPLDLLEAVAGEIDSF
jgi:hypothetical protein